MVDGLSHTVGLFSTQLLTLWWCLQVGVDAWLHDCQCSHKALKKVSFSRLSICRLDYPPATYSASLKNSFSGRFLLRLSGIKRSYLWENLAPVHPILVMFFGLSSEPPRRPFSAKKNKTKIGCCGAKISHRHDFRDAWSCSLLVKNDQKLLETGCPTHSRRES